MARRSAGRRNASNRRDFRAQGRVRTAARQLEGLEQRILLTGAPGEKLESVQLAATESRLLETFPAITTTYLPQGVSRIDLAREAGAYVGTTKDGAASLGTATAGGGVTALIDVTEAEPVGVSGSNDTPGTAEAIAGFGTGVGEDIEADIEGDLAAPTLLPIGTFPEDDGSIPLANETLLTTGNAVIASGTIGDGPFGSAGTGSGDFDFFAIRGATTGQRITVDVDTPFGPLDSILLIYDSFGTLWDFNDDSGGSLDSFIDFIVPANGDYFAMVSGFLSGPSDPFDSASGNGAGSEGPYDVTIILDLPQDQDFYSVDLEAGDILGATVTGGATHLTLYDSGGGELMGSGQDATFIHPAASPLPGGGNASLSWVIDTAGTYSVAVDEGAGPYTLSLRAFRPELESQNRRDHQILFLDFDGESVDATEIWGFGNPEANLSPLSSFLAGWGLGPDDEDAVIDAITASVAESFADVGLLGNNGDFETDGIDGHYDIEIITSRDSTDAFGFPFDPFGSPNVSRVIVGGTIDELGIGTIGIAQSIDVGNFETQETAVVLLDLLSAPASNPNSLNQFVGPPTDIVELIGVGVGNITAHEAGHFFAAWHTNQFNAVPEIMDQGGNLPNTVGVGPDGIFGTTDDVDVDFGQDMFVPNEGFTGTENVLNAIAFGLSTGTVDPGMIVVGSSPANNEQLSSPPTEFVIDFIDSYDPGTVDASDLKVNGIDADSVVLTDADTLTFQYNSNPVTSQGLQTMLMAADSVARLSDSDGVEEFTAVFGYDAILMEVIAVDPPDGSFVELPLTSLTVTVNEPYAPASVGTDDLSLTQGSVVGFNLLDDVNIEYLLDGIVSEGSFTATMVDGALTDAFGNLGLGFTATYELDFGEVPYPVPLVAKEPLGSLIYDPSMEGTIGPDDTDRFAISVDPGQTITVVVEPLDVPSLLQPMVNLFRDNNLLDSATAAEPGDFAVLQTADTQGQLANQGPGPREYVVEVAGNDGSEGAYRVRVILNAAVEDESYGGPSNDEVPQDIEDSFISLLRSVSADTDEIIPDRGAVLGTIERAELMPVLVFDFESGDQGFTVEDLGGSLWHRSTGRGEQPGHSPIHSFYYGQGEGPDGGGTYDTGTPNAGALVSPKISLPDAASVAIDFNYVLETEDFVFFDLAELQISTGGGWTTLASYNGVAESSVWTTAEAVDVSNFAGETVQFRWFFDTLDDFANEFEGWYVDDVRILAADRAADHYSFLLEDGESATLVLTGDALQLQLLDPRGDVVAEHEVGPTNVDLVIRNYVALETGTYTVALAGEGGEDYSLVVMRNAEFELEDNDSLASAQRILSRQAAGRQWLLGYLDPADAVTHFGDGVGPFIPAILDQVGIGADNADSETTATSFVVPGSEGETLDLTFQLEEDTGGFLFTLGFFDRSAVTADPIADRREFAVQAISSGTVLFDDILDDPGATTTLTLDAGTDLGFYLIPNDTVANFLADPDSYYDPPANSGDIFLNNRSPLFSTSNANPGELDQMLAFIANGVTLLTFEDLTRIPGGSSDEDFLDVAISVDAELIPQTTDLVPRGDIFEVTLTRGTPLQVQTATPAVKSGEFVNQLDPMLRLYDAAGNLVASDDNSAVDGRNAKLSFRPPRGAEGTYFIEVTVSGAADEPTGGEYILSVKGNSAELNGVAALALFPGDANLDGVFDSADLVQVFQIGEYEDGVQLNSTFAEGDWNGDGEFDSADLVLAFQNNVYEPGATSQIDSLFARNELFNDLHLGSSDDDELLEVLASDSLGVA